MGSHNLVIYELDELYKIFEEIKKDINFNFEKINKQELLNLKSNANCLILTKKEIPELNAFAKENDDLLVFTFSFDFLEVDDLEPIAERFNIEVPSLITHPSEIWGIDTPPAVPATFFINPKGEVVLSLFRPQTKEELNNIYIQLKKSI